MRGMILAAGLGKRMGALTQQRPKPLLAVAGQPLIEYAIQRLVSAGVRELVINTHYFAEQIVAALGDGRRYGVDIAYSYEPELLETGGGIVKALPLLGDAPFVVVSADVITDYPLQQLSDKLKGLAHLVMVDHAVFAKDAYAVVNNRLMMSHKNTLTYASFGMFTADFFHDCVPGAFRLNDVLQRRVAEGVVSGEIYRGIWHNLGTAADIKHFEKSRAREDLNL